MATVRHTKRQSMWQLKLAQARKNLAWAWDRAQWMALGAVLMWFVQLVWR